MNSQPAPDKIRIDYKRFHIYVGTFIGILAIGWAAWTAVAPADDRNSYEYHARFLYQRSAWQKVKSPKFSHQPSTTQEHARAYLPPRLRNISQPEAATMKEPLWDKEDPVWLLTRDNLLKLYGVLFGMLAVLHLMDRRLQQKITLKLDNSGIEFSPIWKNKLLGRLNRSWDDVHHVWLMGKKTRIVRWEQFILFTGMGPHVFVEFRSGGFAEITLPMLSKSQAGQFFEGLRKWCDSEKLSSDVTKLKEALIAGSGGTGFTEIWVDDLDMRHGSTHFEPLPPDALLQNGRLRIVSELSTGGLSAVYLAEDKSGKRVVVKEAVLPLDVEDSARQKARERFQRECTLLMKVDHPNVARVLDCFVENERDYLVLDYTPGATLRQYVAAKGPQSEKNVLRWAKELAETLVYLHDREPPLVHRDVTPDNIIIRDDGTVVLIDFGAANEFVGTATGTMIGKQCYIPPEQLRGKAEPRSDVYALGATLYFLVTGQDPLALSCSNPRAVKATVSETTAAIIEACTRMECAERLSARDLQSHLESPATLSLKVGVKTT
jgi:tRNA A-37 threonylcarbamoyl transferase component Bud32